MVLSSADGEPNNAIAERLGLTKATVGKWRARFIERRIAGLYDGVRPGKPRTIDDERVAHLIKTTLHTKPANGSRQLKPGFSDSPAGRLAGNRSAVTRGPPHPPG